jgi:hypothetical protein
LIAKFINAIHVARFRRIDRFGVFFDDHFAVVVINTAASQKGSRH